MFLRAPVGTRHSTTPGAEPRTIRASRPMAALGPTRGRGRVMGRGMAETLRSTRQGALGIALAVASIVALIALPGSCKKSKPSTPRIAVIPKGTTHEFWKSVHAGAVKASRELDVDVVWKGPLREDDLKAQIDVVQS